MASIMSVARPLAYGIGDLKYQGMIDSFTHKLLHGIVGGATGALVASSSRAGVNGALSAILADSILFKSGLLPLWSDFNAVLPCKHLNAYVLRRHQ